MARDRSPTEGSSRRRDYRVQPPRPPNAWILYRSSRFKMLRLTNERMSQAVVSKRISVMWKNEAEHVKRHFERMAEGKKAEHQQLYPDYHYSPKRKEEKMRDKEARKQSCRAKKSKARDATPPAADVDAETNATAAIPPPPPVFYMPQPYFLPGYQPNTALPYPYAHYLPETHYGPGGPSPPMSAAPSPPSCESSESPEVQPYPEANVTSSSSSSSVRTSPSSESQASSYSSQLPPNPMYFSSFPSSHQPSPNPYAAQPLPTLLFQSSAPIGLPLGSPHVQLPSAENKVVPAAQVWNNIPTRLSGLDFHNSNEVVQFDIPVNQTQNFAQFPRRLHRSSSLGMLSTTDENGVFNVASVESSNLTAQPQGELEIAMGPPASTVDYNEQLFADFDLAEFQKQMDSLARSSSSSAAVTSSVQDDLQSLFHTPNIPDVQAYTTTQQRQSSVFTQDMMHYFNFEAAGGTDEDTTTVSPLSLPTTVAPQQVRFQSAQHAVAMPIFTQMTNTPTDVSGTSYVPPAGAINASTRRVAGSWKPPFAMPPSQVEDSVQSWAFMN
ncbi:hypothetical protein J3R82DRAFT_10216 [Butyriboletus roseoflavus]|nr:hypothetical protein J3R82DRAFT_10216 [Butyriboletus roseoflavus]